MSDHKICRSDSCEIEEVHTVSLCKTDRRGGIVQPPVKVTKRPAWMQDDPEGLAEAVRRAVPKTLPINFTAITNKVRNDYGDLTERTVYRHVKKLVMRGELLKLNLQLGFAAYVRPGSKLLGDLSQMRDVMADLVDLDPDAA